MTQSLFAENTDFGQRFTVKCLGIGTLFYVDRAHAWYIIDRNTDEAIMGGKEPNGKGKRFWRGTEQAAHWYCAILNRKQGRL